MNPDRMRQAEYDEIAEFKANVLGDARRGPLPHFPPPPEPPNPGQSRLEELYRLLVGRLHPDTRAETEVEVSAIWHDVQEAYGAGNIERPEMLLALTEIQSNAAGEHTTLSQMRTVLAELRRSINALQRNLRASKKEPSWNFARLPGPAVEKRVRHDLDSCIASNEGSCRISKR